MKLAILTTLVFVSRAFELGRFADEQSFLDELPMISIDSIPREDIESIVNRQWFEAAGELIRKSHETDIDISAPIRAGAQAFRTRIDELVKLLDPDYSKPHRLNPAFQWTQNDTSVFIQLKYSRRFNAPGSVDVTDFNCTFTDSSMIFSAIGGHSGKMFEYVLDLDFFDSIQPAYSKWMEGSVGKVSLTILKARVSKWPRLLADKALKIDNMHYWFDFGEKQEGILNAMSSTSDSGLTCSTQGLVYCPFSDQCVSADCAESSCAGKPTLNAQLFRCEGPPSFSPKEMAFTDSDTVRGTITGSVEITLRKNSYDTLFVNLYLIPTGTDLNEKSQFLLTSSAFTGNQTFVDLGTTDLDIGEVDLIGVPLNEYGENRAKLVRLKIADAFVPLNCGLLGDLQFIDSDPVKNSIKGEFMYTLPSDVDGATGLVFYWGKSAFEKHKKDKPLNEATHAIKATIFNLTSPTSVPNGATHVLVFAKGPGGGEIQVGSVVVVDKYRPTKLSNPSLLQLNEEHHVSFTAEPTKENVSYYSVRVLNTKNQTKEIDLIPVVSPEEREYRSVVEFLAKPSYMQLCVYPGNDMGRSNDPACIELSPERSDEL